MIHLYLRLLRKRSYVPFLSVQAKQIRGCSLRGEECVKICFAFLAGVLGVDIDISLLVCT